MKDDESNLEEEDKVNQMNLLSDLKLPLDKENALLNQKARLKWIEQGDNNSKYFHSRIKWRRVTNELRGVDMDGIWCEDHVKVREEVRQVFQKMFSAPKYFDVNIQNFEFQMISEEDNKLLME